MYLFIFFIIYFLLIFVIRSLILWKKTGINPLTFGVKDDAHGYTGKVYKVISFMEMIVIGIYAFKNNWYEYLLPFWYIEHPIAEKIGWSMLIVSLIIVSIAQTHMANSWRIGIDEKNKTNLVTNGLFSVSRNPVFLGIMIANFGVFLIIPNAFMLLIISLSTVSMNIQIRLEEDFLRKELGDEYEQYTKKVRRWF